ncbi:alkaline phosphatase [Exiguobacterium sp. BMC-KP]|uniref:PhoX family protein n=1 Tax=Exiguobacterium sp. BMC-KP TaxID=1684312 RepID=UPI0006AA1775|nr:alkaline phosphatase PhoX [Exiguobacterium sp. BMC-KP]KOP31217.1 alkaline phosphatase [Exiguobacterium sp. BMC-KP]
MKRTLMVGLSAAVLSSSMVPMFADAHSSSHTTRNIKKVEFLSMDAPTKIDQMVKTYTEAKVKVTYTNGKTEVKPLNYNQLFLSQDKIVENKGEMIAAGTPIDAKGNPIIDRSVPDKSEAFVSDAPDSNSLLEVHGKKYMVSHFEYDSIDNAGNEVKGLPASMTLTEVVQDKKTGKLAVKKASKIDFENVNGLWTPCNGSTTPWGTHLGSEEYEPDARAFESDKTSSAYKEVNAFAERYFGTTKKANPYFYGYTPEISVDRKGKATAVKHYSTGRFSHEMMQILPDQKTAIFGDDGNNTMMFMYVADKKRDFSKGTLYAAKFKQTRATEGGAGDLEWIKLGHASDKEVKRLIDKGTKFSDIFETADAPTPGFKAVKTAASKKVEYLKLKPGKEKEAAFLESRRYGALLGATSEFNKMEGITVNEQDKKAYIALSYVSGSTEKQEGAVQDDIQLEKRESGATFEINLGRAKGIDSRYVPTNMQALVIGEDLAKPDAYGNTANPDLVANPDNLAYSATSDTLFIGEDSALHTNNFVWAYNLKTKKLSRILSVPVGAEATGLRSLDHVGGYSYLLSNYQHPGEALTGKQITAVDPKALEQAMKDGIGIQKTGGVGYLSGLPSGHKSYTNR